MQLAPPKNQNYAATIIRVRNTIPLPGLDNLVGVPIFGFQALVGKDVQVGDLMVMFGAETQLSEVFASHNNLYRHSELNADPESKGYLEDNRRVKAIKLRGHRSDALLLPLDSLDIPGVDPAPWNEGDTFDTINGTEICRKYEVLTYATERQFKANQPASKRVDETYFPRHMETPNFFRVGGIETTDYVVVTQKLHGTSVRIGHVQVAKKLNWLGRLAKKLGVPVKETEYAYVYGSRNVVKDPNNPEASAGFYGHDVYTEVGRRLEGVLPKGYVVYGEIVGWVGERPIQPGYTYQIPKGCAELYVYRVSYVSEDGLAVDLSWDAVKEFCLSLGLETVPELWRGTRVTEEWVTGWLDTRFADSALNYNALPTDGTTVDEGICIRKEGLRPYIVKAKSPVFLQHETKQLDKGEADLEAVA